MAKMATLIRDAPEELRHVLMKMKMSKTKADSIKCLGANTINNEMLGKTLAFLMDIQVTDENITRLLKDGKKDMILRQVVNLMPLPCITCNNDTEFKPTDRPQVRCRRCDRGACADCFPEPKNGWAYLCKTCDEVIKKQESIPETLLKQKKVGEQLPGSQAPIQAVNLTEEADDTDEEEDDEFEEAARKREEKRRNEEGARGRKEGGSRREEAADGSQEGGIRRKEEEEKEICKAFKFGGKCPHGMSGKKSHNQWVQCNKFHPKVCSRLLAHGMRSRQGCDGRDCNKYHPRMCYSSTNTKVCTKERCTYWHCKGTSFAPESGSRFEPPARHSLGQYPTLPARQGRSPVRRVDESYRRREEEQGRRERDEQGGRNRRSEDEDHERRREERIRREEREREVRGRGERQKPETAPFLDLAQMIRQEVQRAFLALLPPPGASGSVQGPPGPQMPLGPRNPAAPSTLSWADIFSRNTQN